MHLSHQNMTISVLFLFAKSHLLVLFLDCQSRGLLLETTKMLLQSLCNFTLPVSLERISNSYWPVYLVSLPGEMKDHTHAGDEYVTCCGLHLSTT